MACISAPPSPFVLQPARTVQAMACRRMPPNMQSILQPAPSMQLPPVDSRAGPSPSMAQPPSLHAAGAPLDAGAFGAAMQPRPSMPLAPPVPPTLRGVDTADASQVCEMPPLTAQTTQREREHHHLQYKAQRHYVEEHKNGHIKLCFKFTKAQYCASACMRFNTRLPTRLRTPSGGDKAWPAWQSWA